MRKQIDINGYLGDKGKVVRAQIESLTNEQLALWADKLFSDSFDSPASFIEKEVEQFKKELTPF